MADVAFEKNGIVEYLRSVNTPDFPTAIINPDISGLENVPREYWKISGNKVVEMTKEEKLAVDSQKQTIKNEKLNNLEYIDAVVLAKALVKMGKISKNDLVTALKEVING